MLVPGDSTDRTVLATMLDSVPMTRPELAHRTSLSRPTVAESVRRLVDIGLIADMGVRRGRPGRTATFYGLAPTAG
jgi:predicted transcriptional regulator